MWQRQRPLGTRKGVAALFCVSISTVDNWVKEGRLKPIRFGRLVRFDMDKVEAMIEEAREDDNDL